MKSPSIKEVDQPYLHMSSQTIAYTNKTSALKAITQNGTNDLQPRWERDQNAYGTAETSWAVHVCMKILSLLCRCRPHPLIQTSAHVETRSDEENRGCYDSHNLKPGDGNTV